MKKICYITTISGSMGFFVEQLQYLAQNDLEVVAISSNSNTIKNKLGNKVKFIPVEIPRGISFLGSIKAIITLKKLFDKEKFDLIQYSTPNAAFCASIAARLSGCKNRNYHLMGLRYLGASGGGKAILKCLEKITCRNSTSIECVSKSNMEMGIKEGLFPKEKVTVVWNGSTGGVDCEKFNYNMRKAWRNEKRAELGYKEKDFVYGFVGRITRDKGINELLEAFFLLENPDAKLFLIGRLEGENTINPKLLSHAKKSKNIQFHDAVTDIEKYYAVIDVLVLPSYREGFGNVIIEAGAVGTPAIVSNIPGPIDAIDEGKTALTTEVKSVSDLVLKMNTIRNMDYIDMGINAANYAKNMFNSKVLSEKILERKKALLNKK